MTMFKMFDFDRLEPQIVIFTPTDPLKHALGNLSPVKKKITLLPPLKQNVNYGHFRLF